MILVRSFATFRTLSLSKLSIRTHSVDSHWVNDNWSKKSLTFELLRLWTSLTLSVSLKFDRVVNWLVGSWIDWSGRELMAGPNGRHHRGIFDWSKKCDSFDGEYGRNKLFTFMNRFMTNIDPAEANQGWCINEIMSDHFTEEMDNKWAIY